MQPPPLTRPPQKQSAFSLVEVAIALAIFSIAVVALLGLLPGGLNTYRRAMDLTVTSQIAQKIIHDFEESEFNDVIDLQNLADVTPGDLGGYRYIDPSATIHYKGQPNFTFRAPKLATPALRYFDEQGVELIPATVGGALDATQRSNLVYVVNVRVMPRGGLPLKGETSANVAQITVQIARNPTNAVIPIPSDTPIGGAATVGVSDPNVPGRNLFQPTNGVPIYTYYAVLGNIQGS